jgi:HD-GYP domain-containing protein (c-di-GMP phosphodiesterase class II)
MGSTENTMSAVPERVPLNDVRDLIALGLPLPFRVLDEHARLLLGKGQQVVSESQLAMLLERGAWVERDQVVAVRRLREAAVDFSLAGKVPSARKLTLFDRWEKQVWEFDALQRRIGKFRDLRADLHAQADDVIGLVDRDHDVALFNAVRRDDRRFALYALTHSLHVAALCILTARLLGWDPARVQTLTCAALTMNVSTIELQATLAEQDTAPTARQRELIRNHPQRSAQLLRDSGVDDVQWLAIVEDHHEQIDGGGYPRGIKEVSDLARVLRAADVYMANISPRAQRAPLTPQVAVRQLFQQEQGGVIATAMVRAIGIYPPGDVVQLRSGEIAVVTRRAAKGPAPLVSSVSHTNGMPMLETLKRNTAEPEFAIVGQATPSQMVALPRLLPERFYGLIPGWAEADEGSTAPNPATPGD